MAGFLPKFLSLDVEAYSPKAFAKIIGKAKESIKIMMPDDVPDDFLRNGAIRNAFQKAHEKGIPIYIAFHGAINKIVIYGASGIYATSGIGYYHRHLKKPVKRLVVVIDKKHVLVTRTESELKPATIGLICFDAAAMLVREFDVAFDDLIES